MHFPCSHILVGSLVSCNPKKSARGPPALREARVGAIQRLAHNERKLSLAGESLPRPYGIPVLAALPDSPLHGPRSQEGDCITVHAHLEFPAVGRI